MKQKVLASIAYSFVSIVIFFALMANAQSVTYRLLKKVPLGAAPGGGEYFDYLFAILPHAGFMCPTERK